MRPPLVMSIRSLIAAGVFCLLVVVWCMTLDPRSRKGRAEVNPTEFAPTLTCPTGFDSDGRCVLQNLVGGVHSFLVPGAIASLVLALGGIVAGVGAAYDRLPLPVRRLCQAGLATLESLPRLALLIMVYVLADHSLVVLGITLGTLGIPMLAEPIGAAFFRFQRSDFLAANRAHGISETRIVLYHLLYLSCRRDIIRYAALVFGYAVMAESSLSFVLQSNLSPTELSWGYQLQQSLVSVQAAVVDLARASSGEHISGMERPEAILPQCLSIAGAIGLVLWASQVIVEPPAVMLEEHQDV